MPVEVESSGQIDSFLSVLKKKAFWIGVPVAVCVTLGTSFAIIVPKKYVTKTKVLVRDTLMVGSSGRAGLNTAKEAKVAKHQIRSMARITAVLEELRWPEYLELTRDEKYEFAEMSQERVDVDLAGVVGDSNQQVVNLEFAHANPQRAYEFLVALRERWQNEVLERGRNAEEKNYESLKERRARLQNEHADKSTQLSRLHKEYSIAPRDARTNLRDLPTYDSVFDQLPLIENELEQLEASLESKEMKLEDQRERHARMDERVSTTKTDKGRDYQEEIRRLHQEIVELRQLRDEKGYKPSHPRYQEIQRETEALTEQVRMLESSEVASVAQEVWVPNKKRSNLGDEVEALDAELAQMKGDIERKTQRRAELRERAIELQDVYAQIRRLESEITRNEMLQEEIDLAFQKAQQSLAWVQGPGGNPFEVLAKVRVPTQPTEPNPILIFLLSTFVGLGLGLGSTLASEYTKNCFRSAGDISRVMIVPVLGTVNAIVTRGEWMRRRVARLIMGSATIAFVGMVSYITWAWADAGRHHLLSDQTLNAIEEFRSNFK